MTLNNKTALITGGTGALGHVVAARFLAEGARVAVSYLFEDELKFLEDSFRKSVLIVRADVTHEEDVIALFQQVTGRLGTVQILINIVGGFLPGAKVRDVKTKDWDHMLNINLRSMFLCSRQFLQKLEDNSYGRIISMAAMPALKPSAGRGPYAVSKAGVVTLTQILGEELKGTGVTANAIAPSILRTKANIDAMPNEDADRWVNPEEVAETMMLLCSDRGRSINGVTIPMFAGV